MKNSKQNKFLLYIVQYSTIMYSTNAYCKWHKEIYRKLKKVIQHIHNMILCYITTKNTIKTIKYIKKVSENTKNSQ